MENQLIAKASIQIAKPIADVFEAVADPQQMSNYFISKSSGRIEEGVTLYWEWPEFDGAHPVKVDKVDINKEIRFYWDHNLTPHLVTITFEEKGSDATAVFISEAEEPATEAGLAWYGGNTEGWANFCACLKAWCEFGINLRKNAFSYRFQDIPEK